ncbi:MAG TPA: T9SS type A sorting domain-containing protein [bacterium]|nr:T9SS type A sorting domain-containing protein [bacterium]
MYRQGLTAIGCLLVLVGLAAGLTGHGPSAIGALSIPGISDLAGHSYPHALSLRVAHLMYNNDVGVSKILSPGEYVPSGDTVFPRAEVKNFGTQTQTNIPVTCVVYDSAAGARVYGPDTVHVASLNSGSVDTVAFPPWVAPAQENVYLDTMATALSGDQDTSNDRKAGRFAVTEWWGVEHLTYNDGTFEDAISWVAAGSQLAERFAAPVRPLTISKAVLWITRWQSDTAEDYDAEVRVYADEGSPHGNPGRELGAWVGKLHADTWMTFCKNEAHFDPPVVVDYDTFFVSYYQTSVTPPYPCLALDTMKDTIHIGNDWGIYGDGHQRWGVFGTDRSVDFGIDAYCGSPLLDGAVKDITVPQEQIDSNTTFSPQVVVRNAGLADRHNIPVTFSIVRNSPPRDTVYSGSANSGPVAAGQQVIVTFPDSVKPAVGTYTMTGITQLPFDGNTANDTLVRSLSVGMSGIADENAAVGHPSVSIAPNPLGKLATVHYSLHKAGLVTLDLYDVTGRQVLTQTITAGRNGTANLDLRKLDAGVYLVKVATDGFSTTQKLIIEH